MKFKNRQVEKGEAELEYRGAVHWGFPESTNQEEEGEFLRQSHDLELQYGLTERWLFSTTLTADEPLDADFNVSSVELGLHTSWSQREGNGIGLAFQTEYGVRNARGDPDRIWIRAHRGIGKR